MPGPDATDEQLLVALDAASFELFYVRHVDAVLGFFARRTFDADMAADLCAETFAAALTSRHRFRPAGRERPVPPLSCRRRQRGRSWRD